MTKIAIALERTGERGGAEVLALRLARHLRQAGFECNLIEVPYLRVLHPSIRRALGGRGRVYEILYVVDMLLTYFSMRLTRLHGYDLLVALQPSCLYLRHPKILIYFLHHHRGAYDLYEYLAVGRRGFDLLGFRLAVRLRRILDLGTVAYIRKKHLRVIAISHSVARRLAAQWRIKPGRVLYPGGYEPSFYSLPGAYVLYLGRFQWKEKRIWMIYEAAKQLPDVRFVVAGSGILSEEKPPCNIEFVVTEGLFTEREKADLYARASCLVYPAYDEDFGLVPVEAMSAGKPCLVCSDGGGATETVIDRKTGLVVEPTVQCVADGIRELSQIAESMKEDCIARARSFSWQNFLTGMESEIRALLYK